MEQEIRLRYKAIFGGEAPFKIQDAQQSGENDITFNMELSSLSEC